MIENLDKVYHLKTGHYSYLLRINDYGIPEHLHFGAPVETADFEGFLCRAGLGWGGTVVLEDSDPGSSLDDKALEWSGCGRGDYREPPLELGGKPSDFRFVRGEILTSAPMVSTLPRPDGAGGNPGADLRPARGRADIVLHSL